MDFDAEKRINVCWPAGRKIIDIFIFEFQNYVR